MNWFSLRTPQSATQWEALKGDIWSEPKVANIFLHQALKVKNCLTLTFCRSTSFCWSNDMRDMYKICVCLGRVSRFNLGRGVPSFSLSFQNCDGMCFREETVSTSLRLCLSPFCHFLPRNLNNFHISQDIAPVYTTTHSKAAHQQLFKSFVILTICQKISQAAAARTNLLEEAQQYQKQCQ